MTEGEEHARVSTLWHPNGTRCCYPATPEGQPLGVQLAVNIYEAWLGHIAREKRR